MSRWSKQMQTNELEEHLVSVFLSIVLAYLSNMFYFTFFHSILNLKNLKKFAN